MIIIALKELELIWIPTLIDSSTDYTCDLCCDSSVCSTCADINQFLATDYADCDTIWYGYIGRVTWTRMYKFHHSDSW